MWRRLPTTIALAGLLAVAALHVAVWATALADGSTRAISRHFSTPPEYRGNHGPWRRHRTLRTLSEHATLISIFAVPPFAFLGLSLEKSRRAQIVAALTGVMILVDCAHFPLFD